MKKKRSIIKTWMEYQGIETTDALATCGFIVATIVVGIFLKPRLVKDTDGCSCWENVAAYLVSFFISACLIAGVIIVLLILYGIGLKIMNIIRYQMAFRRFCYLPMTKEECEELNIKSADEYIQFISNELHYRIYSFADESMKDVYFQPSGKDVTHILSTCRTIFPDGEISPVSIWAKGDERKCSCSNWTENTDMH